MMQSARRLAALAAMTAATTAAMTAATTIATMAAAGCHQKGVASAPYIWAADMRAIDRAAARLPAERPRKVHLSVGAPMPARVARKPVPAAVARVLPQYKAAGYTAFRVGQRLAIVDPRGVLAYVDRRRDQAGQLPLRKPRRSVERAADSA